MTKKLTKPEELRLTLSPEKLLTYADEGKDLIFQPKAEEGVVKLLKHQQKVEEAIDILKEALQEAGETFLPGFKGVDSEKIRVMNRKYGSKYSLVKGVKADDEFIEKRTKLSIDSGAVDDYIKEHGEMPKGIEKNIRNKSLSITLKND